MYTVPFVGWIANAAARLMGPHGAVTEQAQKSGCSRQSVYDHAQKVKAAVEGEHGGGPMRAELVEENQACRQENAQLLSVAARLGTSMGDQRVPARRLLRDAIYRF